MKLILEGPDCAGKSTIGRILSQELGIPFRETLHRVSPSEAVAAHKADLSRDGDWIMDRSYWLSDLIYEPLVSGNKSVFEPIPLEMCELLRDTDTYVCFVNVSEENIHKRMARGDELWSPEQICLAKRRYERHIEVLQTFTDRIFEVSNNELEVFICIHQIISKMKEIGLCK